jgi:hypothetical protein
MKKKLSILGVAFILSIFLCSPLLAVPTLQLDILDGTYDPITETIMATGNQFTLRALVKDGYISNPYYISAAYLPQADSTGGLGSFSFAGNAVDSGDLIYGNPPVDVVANNLDLPSHDIFPTYYYEYAFSFISDEDHKIAEYNANPDDSDGPVSGNYLYYYDFIINTTALGNGYSLHFDLYNETFKTNKKGEGSYSVDDFAPFSHDAQSNPIPEPATMLLLGSGLIGISGLGRKKFFKRS